MDLSEFFPLKGHQQSYKMMHHKMVCHIGITPIQAGEVWSFLQGWARCGPVHPEGPGQSSIKQCQMPRCMVSFDGLVIDLSESALKPECRHQGAEIFRSDCNHSNFWLEKPKNDLSKKTHKGTTSEPEQPPSDHRHG